VLGVALIVVGLLLLGYVGWQLWGTNWVSHRKHERIATALEQGWGRGRAAVEIDEVAVTAVVRVPRFGEEYVVPVLAGTSDNALAAGFGHFDGAAMPGGVGNYALAAHRVTHGEPLRQMPELRSGDEILIETRTKTYTYVLDTSGDDLMVDESEGWVTDPLPDNPERNEAEPLQQQGQRLITLTTCAELFHTDDRMVAFGHLESVTSKHRTDARDQRASSRSTPGAEAGRMTAATTGGNGEWTRSTERR
jgi:sortase A